MPKFAGMELLLNIIWVLLTIPALWIWRQKATPVAGGRRFTAVNYVFILGVALLLLFPVISADDDVRALQAESEESAVAPGKRLRQADGDRREHLASPAAPPALLAFALLPEPSFQILSLIAVRSNVSPNSPVSSVHSGRAPPSFRLA